MKIKQLYPETGAEFRIVSLYDKHYAVNCENLDIRMEVGKSLTGAFQFHFNGKDLLFTYGGALIQISGAKACYLHNERRFHVCKLLLIFSEEDEIYFYSLNKDFEKANITENDESCEVGWKLLAKRKASNFEYFKCFYQKELAKPRERDDDRIFPHEHEKVEPDSPMFMLHAISYGIRDWKDEYYSYAYGDSSEVFNLCESEKKVTTFIRIAEDSFKIHDFVGNDFKIVKYHSWDRSWSSSYYWNTHNGEWILNGNELVDLVSFRVYDISPFVRALGDVHVSLWKLPGEELHIFFEKKTESLKILKNAVLWNPDSGVTYPEDIDVKNFTSKEDLPVFWHWDNLNIPNAILTKKGDNEVYQVWYRENDGKTFNKFETFERPVVFGPTGEKQIYFIKIDGISRMIILNHALEIIASYDDVVFFEEISPEKKYSSSLVRNLEDPGKYFVKKMRESYYLADNHILILKRKNAEGKEYFSIFWNNKDSTELDDSVPFVSYRFVQLENPGYWKTEAMEIEPLVAIDANDSYYISICSKKITTLKQEVEMKIKRGY